MIKKTIFCIVLIMFFLTGCTSEEVKLQREYISKAKEVSAKYGLDDVSFSFTYEGEVFSIRSHKFSDLSDEQKYLYLREIDKIIENSNPRAWAMIVSGDVYQLDPDFENGFSDSGSGMVFPYGAPTDKPSNNKIFNPPVEVELVSNTELDFLLAGETVGYLIDYEKYSPRIHYDERVRLNQIYEKGYAFYIYEDTRVLLLEIDDSFAKIQLLEHNVEKKVGTIGWIRISNIKSYPKP